MCEPPNSTCYSESNSYILRDCWKLCEKVVNTSVQKNGVSYLCGAVYACVRALHE